MGSLVLHSGSCVKLSTPPILKVIAGPSEFPFSLNVSLQGNATQGPGLPDVCPVGKVVSATWFADSVCRGASTKGSFRIEGFEPIPISVAHNEQGQTFVHHKGRRRFTAFSAPAWDWRAAADKPVEGRAADIEIQSLHAVNKASIMKVTMRQATESELKRYLQQRALQEAEELSDYDSLHAQVAKAKMAGVDMVYIEHATDKLSQMRKQNLHVAEGADKETLRRLMVWEATTLSDLMRTNRPCTASSTCPCNDEENPGEVLSVVPNAIQDCLREFGPQGDKQFFEELVEAALTVQEGAVWKAGGKFIFSAFDRNQSVNALVRMLTQNGREKCAKMILQIVKYSEARYGGFVTSVQANFHPHGGTHHAQHRDIYSAKQRAGPNCTCSFKKCLGTVCYSVGSARPCLLETMTDEMSNIRPCGENCQGRSEVRWMHSGDSMFFNEAWNANHTHGIPAMTEMHPDMPSGPRISVAFLLGEDESKYQLNI